ncbi:hypothetical protein H2200_006748 [Cladophialophora chaetospira]|uniref:Choline transport protein n=1 Tax=Cladophialophora chaetospira TaxID=386627 RepID=A0AA38X8X1_9EURO|nr:hypothetical protein H2200_006748 [Cladophialophora chaetospira]
MEDTASKPGAHEVEFNALHPTLSEDTQPVDSKHVAGTTLLSANIRKTIKPLTMLAICFNICSSWAGLATSVQIALLQGGPMTLIYGILLTTVIYLGIALLLAELASIYPTAGGQYHFTSILAPERTSRGFSYVCGFITAFYWIGMGAGVSIITSYQIVALANYYDEGSLSHRWQLFLIYQALAFSVLLYNIFVIKSFPATHTIGFVLSISLFIIMFVGLLARSEPKATNTFVWDSFINVTGWPDGVTFMTGLLTPFFMYCGLDGALHLTEEADKPRIVVPRVCVGVIIVGFCTAFPFAIAILYSISDFEALATSTGWIPFEINQQGFRSDTAAVTLLIAGTILGFFILNATVQGSSRVVWAFARDQGFAFSSTLSIIHPGLDVPVWALLLNWSLLAALGFLILASSVGTLSCRKQPPFPSVKSPLLLNTPLTFVFTAFNAIISSTVVHQLLSFFIPFALLLYRRRSEDFLPRGRAFALPRWLGWTVNVAVTLVIPVLVTFFTFPPFLPVTGVNMNYTVVVLGIVLICGILNWFLFARKHYQGPRMEWQL